MYLLYNLVMLVSGLFLAPYYYFYGLKHGKSHRGTRERLGFYTPEQLALFAGSRILWIHAASVGEARAVMPLLEELRRRYPDCRLLMTNMTENGHEIAQNHPDIDISLFPPFDLSWVVKRSFLQIRPQAVLIAETELWPNFCRAAQANAIPLVLVNGRISERSYSRYRLIRFVLKPLLDSFTAICMQSHADKERIIALGAPQERVHNTGNLKYDHEVRQVSHDQVTLLKRRYRIPPDTLVFVAGSTHAGEEKLIVQSYLKIRGQLEQDLLLILAPRHPERRRDVKGAVVESGLEARYRSRLTESSPLQQKRQVLIIDTIGELLDVYAIADLVFIGGSLVPVGGHNLLEAALVGKPVVFGPYIQNFREISGKLVAAGAGIKVTDSTDLEEKGVFLLRDGGCRNAMGQAGQALMRENSGAVSRTLNHIDRILDR